MLVQRALAASPQTGHRDQTPGLSSKCWGSLSRRGYWEAGKGIPVPGLPVHHMPTCPRKPRPHSHVCTSPTQPQYAVGRPHPPRLGGPSPRHRGPEGRGARVSLHSEARWECGHCRMAQKVPHKENNRPFPQRLPWALRGFPPLFPFPQTPRTVSPLGRRTPPANEERGPEQCRGLLQGHPQVWSHLSGPEAGGGRAIRQQLEHQAVTPGSADPT